MITFLKLLVEITVKNLFPDLNLWLNITSELFKCYSFLYLRPKQKSFSNSTMFSTSLLNNVFFSNKFLSSSMTFLLNHVYPKFNIVFIQPFTSTVNISICLTTSSVKQYIWSKQSPPFINVIFQRISSLK